MSAMARVALLSVGVLLVTACGGGSGGGGGTPPPPATYTVGGTVAGLSGTGLVLQNNGGNNLSVAASGSFSFPTALAAGSGYNVTVLSQPSNPTQVCNVGAGGGGTIGSASVTGVSITCTTSTYSVGGTVSGLVGTGLVLQNNGGNDLTVNANGAFAFSALIASGSSYALTVKAQPTGEVCTVESGSGTVGSAAVANAKVTCSPPPGGFLYVPNQASNNVSAYAIDASTGTLTAVPGSPFATAASPAVASLHPSRKFLYVSTRGSASTPPVLSGYAIDATTGALTPMNGSPFALSVASPPANGQVQQIGRLLIHSSGLFGYVTIPVPAGKIYGLAVNPTTGELTEISSMPITLGHELYTGAFSSSGGFVYFPAIVSTPGPVGIVRSYQIDQPSGVLTPIGSFETQSRGGTMAVLTPGDEFLLTPNVYFPNVSVLDVNPGAGTMSPIAGSPVALGAATLPFALTYHRGQNFFYVTDSASPTVYALRLNTTTSAVTSIAGSPYTVGTGQLGPAVLDPLQRFLFVPLRTANGIQAYKIDQTTGALTPAAGTPFATESSPAVVSDPSGRFLFVSNAGSHTASSYSIEGTTGALNLINTLAAGQSPQLGELLAP